MFLCSRIRVHSEIWDAQALPGQHSALSAREDSRACPLQHALLVSILLLHSNRNPRTWPKLAGPRKPLRRRAPVTLAPADRAVLGSHVAVYPYSERFLEARLQRDIDHLTFLIESAFPCRADLPVPCLLRGGKADSGQEVATFVQAGLRCK